MNANVSDMTDLKLNLCTTFFEKIYSETDTHFNSRYNPTRQNHAVYVSKLAVVLLEPRLRSVTILSDDYKIFYNITEVKFNTDNWRNYYNAEIDEAYLKDLFKEYECSRVTSAHFYDETLDVRLEADFSGIVYPSRYYNKSDDGVESQEGVEIDATYFCEIYYKVGNLDGRIEDFNESLNNAIKNGESKFEIIVPFVIDEIYDIQLEDAEACGEDVEESFILEPIFDAVACRLDNVADKWETLEITGGNPIQPPQDKEIKFICTIPAE